MPRRPTTLPILAAALLFPSLATLFAGCATDRANASADSLLHKSSVASKTHKTDDSDARNGDTEWNDVGRRARADTMVEKENDPLRKFFVSPKAQDIERSLGVD